MRLLTLVVCFWLTFSSAAMAQKELPRPLRDWLPKDAKKNSSGLQPQQERLPPLRRIADPANLESKVPSIKAAAEIKQQEDLKAQKVKALRYLASVGCGCYNADGKITDALLASLTDCTEEVRLATVEVIQFTASSGRCQHCNQMKCCDEEVVKKLAEMAYELDDKGCPVEPSARVRAAAIKAMCACCPGRAAPPVEPPPPVIPEVLPIPESELQPLIPESELPIPRRGEDDEDGTSANAEGPVGPSQWRIRSAPLVPTSANAAVGEGVTSADGSEGVAVAKSSDEALPGRISQIHASAGAVVISFEGQVPAKDARLLVYHRHSLGRISTAGELEIAAIDGQRVLARPTVGAAGISRLAVGDVVVVRP
ncbi:MAG: hypothetical protein KF774_18960 [Planctomyces sp.]|nr:hypothetical protein [Planctomyces sp.]